MFVMIPKNASRSMALAIQSMGLPCIVVEGQHRPFIPFATKFRASYSKYKGFKRLAVVRNPYDRMVSLYHWRGNQEKDFNDWLCEDKMNMNPKDMVGWPFEINLTKMPQILWFNGFKFDTIRFENLLIDWWHYCDRNGLPKIKPDHHHKTDREPYQNYYNRKGKDWIERYFADDLRRFGYDF